MLSPRRRGGGGGGHDVGVGPVLSPTGADAYMGEAAADLRAIADALVAAVAAAGGGGRGVPPALLDALAAADVGLWHRVMHGGRW